MLSERIKSIKYNRLSHNVKYMMSIFDNMDLLINKQYPKSCFYVKDDIIIIELLDENIYINRDLFHKLFNNLSLPVKNGDYLDSEICGFLKKYQGIENKTLYTVSAYEKKWKHIQRHIISTKNKHLYI